MSEKQELKPCPTPHPLEYENGILIHELDKCKNLLRQYAETENAAIQAQAALIEQMAEALALCEKYYGEDSDVFYILRGTLAEYNKWKEKNDE